MDWVYEQSTGKLTRGGVLIGYGYSGFGDGKNNPDMEQTADVGPIPRGWWTIGPAHDTEAHGPMVMSLTPQIGTRTFGRSGFLIHGDSLEHPGEASHGCVVMMFADRVQIAGSVQHGAMFHVV